ncbi:response regulator transcription factor [Wukongibacter baidiensis]|uniref:response regulator transcription factor n=1 Tax=Wukongibacter baidiensis TaxID=1723361 RepID=UPI003D7F95B7
MSNERILVIDDEKDIAELIKDYLEDEAFQVKIALDGEKAFTKFEEFDPQLLLLDIMLPKVDGMEVCRIIRSKSDVPILMLSAKKSDMNKVLGLGLGADDYITKPFSPSELVARVKAHLRRYTKLQSPSIEKEFLVFDNLKIDLKNYVLFMDDQEISLSKKEFDVLKFLALNANQTVTREQIFNHVWGYDYYGDMNTVTVHIRNLRKKIEKDTANPKFIKTIWSIGYRFLGDNYEARI